MSTLLTEIGPGFLYPNFFSIIPNLSAGAGGPINTASCGTLDAANEKIVVVGQIKWDGFAASKTVSAAGGGSIWWRTATGCTWATANSKIRIGLTGVSTTGGPPIQDDGLWGGPYGERVQGTDALANSTWYQQDISSGTGTYTTGDKVALVVELITRNGSDAVTVLGNSGAAQHVPQCSSYLGSTWASVTGFPACVIIADDGTVGYIYGTIPGYHPSRTAATAAASNPDEFCTIFQLQSQRSVSGIWASLSCAATDSEYTIALYSDPLGTPAIMSSGTAKYDGLGEQANANGTNAERMCISLFPTPITLEANTDYAVGVAATSTGNIAVNNIILADASFRNLIMGDTTIQSGSRQNGSGAFGSTSTTTINLCGVILQGGHDGAGGGPVMGGLIVM